MSEDNEYPDESQLKAIREWKPEGGCNFLQIMALAKEAWWMADWGWRERDVKNVLDRKVRRFSVSTGGWSGNEDVIGALMDNKIFWLMCWESSRRGGHYVFEVTL